ncbi:nucleotide-binding universal stress UspA family protein [Rhodanobacter sp. TND4EL1]
MFQHILVPTDGSDLASRALDTAIELATKLGARIHAFHVIAPFPASTYFAEFVLANEPTYIEEATTHAERYLADARQRAAVAGVPCETSFETDARPYSAIVGATRKQQCDLIVMASHGWRGFDRLLLGSETHKVILNGDVPVLVCR